MKDKLAVGTPVAKLNRPFVKHFINKKQFCIRFKNSFLTPKFLFRFIIRDQDYDHILNDRPTKSLYWKMQKCIARLLWFWPKVLEARVWTKTTS